MPLLLQGLGMPHHRYNAYPTFSVALVCWASLRCSSNVLEFGCRKFSILLYNKAYKLKKLNTHLCSSVSMSESIADAA